MLDKFEPSLHIKIYTFVAQGMTEMMLIPTKPNLKKVKLNSKQCRIYKITLNGKWETKFDYYDLTQAIIPAEVPHEFTVGQFAEHHRNAVNEGDPDAGGGITAPGTYDL